MNVRLSESVEVSVEVGLVNRDICPFSESRSGTKKRIEIMLTRRIRRVDENGNGYQNYIHFNNVCRVCRFLKVYRLDSSCSKIRHAKAVVGIQ